MKYPVTAFMFALLCSTAHAQTTAPAQRTPIYDGVTITGRSVSAFPTAPAGDNTTKPATDAFVATAVANEATTARANEATNATGITKVSNFTKYCFGITANGTTDDSAALAACRLNAPTGSSIRVPHGDMRITSWPATTPGFVIWEFDGTTFNGGQPLTGIGTDLIEATINNSKWFTRSSSVPDTGTQVRLNQTFNSVGGTTGNVVSNLNVGCDLPSSGGDMNNYVWCNQTVMTSSATGPGQHVASSATVFRPHNALADGRGPRSQNWSGYFENQDMTGQPSNLSGSMVGIENDIYANGDDPLNYRIGLQMEIAKSDPNGSTLRVGRAISIGANDTSSFYGRGIDFQGKYDTAAFDLSSSTSMNGAPAIRLGTNQYIDFSANNSQELRYNSTTASLEYNVNGTTKFGIDNNGVTKVGGLTASGGAAAVAVNITSTATVGVNTSGATISGDAIRLAGNQTIGMEATGQATLRYDATSNMLKYAFSKADLFSIDQAGNTNQLGQLTARGVIIGGTNVVGLDLSTGVFTGPALRLAAGQSIALENTGVITALYDSVSQRVKISWGGVAKFSIDGNGNIRAAGTITPNVAP